MLLSSLFMLVAAEAQTTVLRQWRVAASLPAAGADVATGVAGALAGMHADRLLVAGGANFPGAMPWMGGVKEYHSIGYVFENNSKGTPSQAGTFRLPYPVAYGASCTTPQGVVYAGGETPGGLTRTVLLLQWPEGATQPVVRYLPELPEPVANSAIATDGKRVFLAGGETKGTVSDQFLCLDLTDTARGWQQLPSLPHPVSHAALLFDAVERTCFLAGGRKRNAGDTSTLYAHLYAFTLNAGNWKSRQPLPYALSAGTAIAAGGGLLLLGGDKGETFHKAEALISAIAREQDPGRKAALDRQKAALQSAHPGFSKEVLFYDPAADKWSVAGSIPYLVPVTTTALVWKNNAYLVSGEIKAGIRTPYILAATIVRHKPAGHKK